MSLIKKLAGESVIYGLSSILPRILNILVSMTYITYRFPNHEEVGIYNILYAYTALLLTIFVFRLDTAYFRFASGKEGDDRVFSSALIPLCLSTVVLGSLVFAFAQPIATALGYEDSPQYIRWFSIIIACDVYSAMFYGRFRLEKRPLRFLAYRLLNVLLIIGFTLFLLEVAPRMMPSLITALGQVFTISREIDYTYVANVLASIIVMLAMIPEAIKTKWVYDHATFKKMIKYAYPLVIVGVAGTISQTFATPLQERWISDDLLYNREQAGIYGSVSKIAIFINLVIIAYNYAAEPFFFSNSTRTDAKSLYGKITYLFTICISVATVAIMAYLDLILLFIGESYRSGVAIVPYLLFSFIFLGLYYNFSIWYKLTDKTKIGAWISVSGMVIMVGLNYWLLPRYGYVASSWAVMACYAFMATMGYLTGQKYYPIEYPIGKMVLIIGAAFLSTLLLNYATSWIYGTLILFAYILAIFLWQGKAIAEMIRTK